jgi:hypothetical protein
MIKDQRIRAVQQVMDWTESWMAALAEMADILAALDDKTADEAYLATAQGRLASAKESAKAAVAALRQWLKKAKNNDAGD